METPQKTHIVGHSLSGAQVVQILDEPSPQKMKVDRKEVQLDQVDEELYKLDGREKLAGTEKKRCAQFQLHFDGSCRSQATQASLHVCVAVLETSQ